MKKIFILLLICTIANILEAKKAFQSDWVFIYYMPYDNDLSKHGDTIISMIKEQLDSANIIAIVQADFDKDGDMARYIIKHDTIIKVQVMGEHSANPNTYFDYLKWVATFFEYENSAVIFLDHGGVLDELCVDSYPKEEFLKVNDLRIVLRAFNKLQSKKIDLLFFQVCTKGVIEAMYEFKDVANYSLASQTTLGAPNYYYPNLFGMLSKKKDFDGLVVAKLIAHLEDTTMFYSFSCIDNMKFDTAKILHNQLMQKLKSKKIKLSASPKEDTYVSEDYWDYVDFIKNIKTADTTIIKLKDELITFVETELIVFHRVNPLNSKMKGYCGLSTLNTSKGYSEKMKRYKELQFFKDFKTKPSKVLKKEKE